MAIGLPCSRTCLKNENLTVYIQDSQIKECLIVTCYKYKFHKLKEVASCNWKEKDPFNCNFTFLHIWDLLNNDFDSSRFIIFLYFMFVTTVDIGLAFLM